MDCCAIHRAIKTTAQGLLFSPIKHMCVGSVWQGTGQYLAGHPIPPLIHPQGRYMAAIQCFLYALCLAKHLEPMSRVGLAKCHTAFFKKDSGTCPHAQPPTKLNLTSKLQTGKRKVLTVRKLTRIGRKKGKE